MEEIRGLPQLFSSTEQSGRENIASDITQLVGWTPLVELKNIVEKDGLDVRLIGKIESYQPLSSVKDRSGLRMIEDAEEKGLIKPGITTLVEPTSGNLGISLANQPGITTLVEPTSGNLGISLAFIAVRRGYKFIAVMPANYSLDKRVILRCLGAEVSLTDPKLGIQGILDRIEQLKNDHHGVHVLDQFSNPANPDAHFRWTGPEIWNDTAGKVDIFVCGAGSGGTVSGVGRYLKTKNPAVKIVCVEPAESPVLSGGEPGKHNIQGIGPGFIPNVLDMSCVDEVMTVTTEEAMACTRRLPVEEGLFVGISSGGNVAACIKLAGRAENKGKMIVTLLPSSGERYLSTELFAELREECMKMTF